ncbi:glycosyltransferase [Sphingobacterium yanglingense]|uniref:Glycosyltransferase involved in cell wall biosynthesis n=1 Tax=Sphingobacterium yanglingense TaxID=1437280 RepID=A0A4R6W505_9SPHI|nr:glycosyltransferase [Sphingobacterium yanglingense]TDQ72215.1 glycosyltransferase involved in cell wall biosynthesis [Sphingobacterium yanglingense]
MLKVLFIGLVWPEPTSSAAGWRMLHLVRLFSRGYEVHFASAAGKGEHSCDLTSLGIVEHTIQLNDSSFDCFIRELAPSIVVFDRFMVEEQYGWRVAEHCPDSLRILDTEDLHFVRLARQEAFKKAQTVDYRSDTAKREIGAILRSDLSLIISKEEITLLTEDFAVPIERLFYLPFQEEKLTEAHFSYLPDFGQRKDFVFIGNFIHEPNWRTVEILKRDIWPEIKKREADAELHIFGAYVSEKVLQLHKPKERFLIKGRAEDARKTIANYRVLLAPIPFGAGAKGKLVDAMYSGTPSVSSRIGAESMQQNGEWGGFITDDSAAFVDHSLQLYREKTIWEEKQKLGFAIFNSLYADNSYSERLLKAVLEIQDDIISFRKSNFIAEILMHQSFQSTKYMSLWIEMKNKNKS